MIEIVKITAGEQKPETINLATCFNSDCRVKPSGYSKTSIKEAIEDWNTRV